MSRANAAIKGNQGVGMPRHLCAMIIIREKGTGRSNEGPRLSDAVSRRGGKRISKEVRELRNDARAGRRSRVCPLPCTSEWDERIENMAMIFTNSASA